jgi:putative hemolysin
MVLTSVLALAGVLVFAAASFFFALAETSLFSLGKWRARQLAEQSPGRGGLVLRLLEQPQELLATIVLGNTFANAAMVATALWSVLEDNRPITALALVALFVIILLGCEVVPKTLAVRMPESWAVRVAVPMLFWMRLTRPFHALAQGFNARVLAAVVPATTRVQGPLTEGEYQELLELAFQQGTLARSEKEIILQIVNLDRRTVRDAMKPRSRMACIPDDLSVEDMIGAARRFKHRRLPLYDETPDTIVGVLNTRALLLDPQIDLADAIEFPSFVPESMNLLQLLKSLQRQQRGIAIVLDEFGGTAGVVTMEDILGQIIGEIHSEVESAGFVMEKLADGKWRVNGTMRLDDFRREYPELGEVNEVETMGGLLVAQMDVVPTVGQSVQFRGLRLTARAADERRVREVLVEKMRKA